MCRGTGGGTNLGDSRHLWPQGTSSPMALTQSPFTALFGWKSPPFLVCAKNQGIQPTLFPWSVFSGIKWQLFGILVSVSERKPNSSAPSSALSCILFPNTCWSTFGCSLFQVSSTSYFLPLKISSKTQAQNWGWQHLPVTLCLPNSCQLILNSNFTSRHSSPFHTIQLKLQFRTLALLVWRQNLSNDSQRFFTADPYFMVHPLSNCESWICIEFQLDLFRYLPFTSKFSLRPDGGWYTTITPRHYSSLLNAEPITCLIMVFTWPCLQLPFLCLWKLSCWPCSMTLWMLNRLGARSSRDLVVVQECWKCMNRVKTVFQLLRRRARWRNLRLIPPRHQLSPGVRGTVRFGSLKSDDRLWFLQAVQSSVETFPSPQTWRFWLVKLARLISQLGDTFIIRTRSPKSSLSSVVTCKPLHRPFSKSSLANCSFHHNLQNFHRFDQRFNIKRLRFFVAGWEWWSKSAARFIDLYLFLETPRARLLYNSPV